MQQRRSGGSESPNQNEYLRAAEVARLLHVSPKTVSRWAKENKLPYVRTLGGHRRFPAKAIRELAERLASEGGLPELDR
ncbi:MAG: helix-turn-helix domain-containing protein [Candidatus Methylomirabilales bacterium]